MFLLFYTFASIAGMKKLLTILFILTAGQSVGQKAVFIIADGIPADVIENAATPNIKRIAKAGTYTRAHVGGDKDLYNQTPTISAVGYNSLLTVPGLINTMFGTTILKHPTIIIPLFLSCLKCNILPKKLACTAPG